MLDHKTSELVKFAECGGDVLNERPDKATEAILLFLQGCGYCKFYLPACVQSVETVE